LSDSAAAKLKSLLDASGFPFQLAVEQAVRSLPESKGWRVTGREYPFRTANGTKYIDLVVSNGMTHLVIECKRSREATWVFLMPDEKQIKRSHARICWTDTKPQRRSLMGWGDVQVDPASPESEFCAVRGQGEKGTPLLERIASATSEAADGLARDLLKLRRGEDVSNVVIPVIVTNTDLVVSAFHPSDVDLLTGDVNAPDFSAVQHVRFRKSLADSAVPDEFEPEFLDDLAAASERTVFVVRSSHLAQWLDDFQMSAPDQSSPWVNARHAEEAMG